MKLVHIYGRNKNARCARCSNPFHYHEQAMTSYGYNHRRKYYHVACAETLYH